MCLTFAFRMLLVAALLLLAASACGQEKGELQEKRRLAMTMRAGTVKLHYQGMPERVSPVLMKAPVLKTNDATRGEVDGALWLWLDGQRPVAAMCITYYDSGKWNYENVTLTDEALALSGRPGWVWEPKAAPRNWTALDDAVPDAPRARQLALRSLPRQFEISEVRRGERFPLRLIGQPIYSYADPDEGVTDAALFAASYGTNPEVLVQVEARLEGNQRRWHVAFARLTAAEATVKLGDKELWKVAPISVGEYDMHEGYYATNEPDRPEPD